MQNSWWFENMFGEYSSQHVSLWFVMLFIFLPWVSMQTSLQHNSPEKTTKHNSLENTLAPLQTSYCICCSIPIEILHHANASNHKIPSVFVVWNRASIYVRAAANGNKRCFWSINSSLTHPEANFTSPIILHIRKTWPVEWNTKTTP